MSRIISVLACLVLFLSACSQEQTETFVCQDQLGCVTLAPGEPVKIISMHVLSGDLARSGRENVNTAKLAAADRGKQIHGHPVLIIPEDSQCTREGGFVIAQKVVTDPSVVGVHGTTCSVSSVPAAEIISEAGLSMISGSVTSPSLTSPNDHKGRHWQPGFYRTAANDKHMGYAAAYFAKNELGLVKAATIHDGDPYTRTLISVFETEFKNLGGRIVFSGEVTRSDRDMGPLLEAVQRSEADILFFPIFPPTGDRIVLQAKQSKSLENLALMSGDGLMNSAFIQRVGSAAQGMYFVIPMLKQSKAARDFLVRYAQTFNQTIEGVFYGHHYDAARILLDSIEKAAVKTEDGLLVIGRQDLRDAIRSLDNYKGLTGDLSCDEYGDCGVPRYKLVRIDDSRDNFEAISENIISVFERENLNP
ncbi:MAG: branched-chain amino acid ABC transporter substrate-binding protein [Desulfonatronovibrio sp.]